MKAPAETATTERRSFQAEVSRLLHIVANSLYSDRDVFLRELISNASDACDKLRYEAITDPSLTADDPAFRVALETDKKAGILRVIDNGIGMNRVDLVENLGTIARSGTAAFVEQVESAEKAEKKDAVSLIGQFGVGFYSAFMVADRVTVTSRRAGETDAWQWESDGLGEFTVAPAERAGRGTTVELHLRNDAKGYLDAAELRRIVKKHSDHVGLPIVLTDAAGKDETLNDASALWTRAKNEITDEQYAEFYHHVSGHFDKPWLTLHARAEGKIEYTLLLFVPSSRPFDIFDPERRHHVKLYVKRVFVTGDMEGLVPPYLRFLCGIVDSQDLDLNVSREMLQSSPLVAKIRKDIAKRIFRELKRKAEKDREAFQKFWKEFGAVLKEGLYEEAEARGDILAIARFRSTVHDAGTSLADYVAGMKEGQQAIYYITGDDAAALAKSPQIEGFKSRGIEVLLLSDPVDDFWIGAIGEYEGKPFKSVTRSSTDLKDIPVEGAGEKPKDDANADASIGSLLALLKLTLKDEVQDVRTSDRLTDSPVCLVAADGGLDMHIERMLKQHGRVQATTPRILEINAGHSLIKAFAALAGAEGAADRLEDAAYLLLDQARILEGELPADPSAFTRRLAAVMTQAVAR